MPQNNRSSAQPVQLARHGASRGRVAATPLYYLVDWLPPDFGAVGQYALRFAREWAESGRDVCLIGLTRGPASVARETFASGGKLEIRRLSAKPCDKSSHAKRLIWSIVANVRLITQFALDRSAHGAELMITGSPPFMLFLALPAKWLRKATLRFRTTDFYPEVIIADRGRSSVFLRALERVTWWMRRRVDVFEVLGEDQRRLLLDAGIAAGRIELRRDMPPSDLAGDRLQVTLPFGLDDKFVLLYSGNWGVAHDTKTTVEGLKHHQHQGTSRFALWLNATGANADVVEGALAAAEVAHARTRPGPLTEFAHILAAADAHLITLRNEFAGYVLPSKVHACLASNKPILFVGPESSDVHLLASGRPNAVYERVDVGDAEGFAAALERIADAVASEPKSDRQQDVAHAA